jgi:hypothetical protein
MEVIIEVLEDLAATICPEDGGSKFLRNFGNHLHDNTVSHPRRSQSKFQTANSCPSLWARDIRNNWCDKTLRKYL